MGGEVIGAVIGGAVVGAVSGVITGAVGSAIMQSANHTGYDVLEAVEMGAVGGSLFLSGAALIGGLTTFGLYSSKASMAGTGALYIANCLLSGLIGYAILHEATHQVAMKLEETAIAFAVGALVWGSSSTVMALIAVCCGAMVGGHFMRNQSQANDVETGFDWDEFRSTHGLKPRFASLPNYGAFNGVSVSFK